MTTSETIKCALCFHIISSAIADRPNIGFSNNKMGVMEGEYVTLTIDANPPVLYVECTVDEVGLTFYGPKILVTTNMAGDNGICEMECAAFNYFLGDYHKGSLRIQVPVLKGKHQTHTHEHTGEISDFVTIGGNCFSLIPMLTNCISRWLMSFFLKQGQL